MANSDEEGADRSLPQLAAERQANTTMIFGLLLFISSVMGALPSKNFFSRSEHAGDGLGVKLHTLTRKKAPGDVERIENKMSRKLVRFTTRVNANFLTGTRQGHVVASAAASANRRSERSSTSPGLLSSSETASTPKPATQPASLPTARTTVSRDECLFFYPGGGFRERRRLHVEDAMELGKGHSLVVVIRDSSEDYGRFLARDFALPNSSGLSRSFDRTQSLTCIQFMATVTSNPTGQRILDGLEPDPKLQITQGAGLAINLDGGTGPPMEIKFTSILYSNVELWDLNPEGRPPRDYSRIFPEHRTGVFANYELVLDQLMAEVDFCPRAALSFIQAATFYRDSTAAKGEKKKDARSKARAADTGDEDVSSEKLKHAMEQEINDFGLDFAASLDRASLVAFEGHFNWKSPDEPILDWPYWFEAMSLAMPLHWASLETSAGKWGHRPGNEGLLANRDAFKFLTIVGLFRQRNPLLLCNFALMGALAGESNGETVGSSRYERGMRIETSVSHLARFIEKNHTEAVEKQRALLKQEVEVDFIFDNYQRFTHLKNQRGGQSSTSQEGTVRVALRRMVRQWPAGTVLMFDGAEHTVLKSNIAADYHSCEYLVRSPTGPEVDDARQFSVTLPRERWSVDSSPGMKPHPAIIYVNQTLNLPPSMVTFSIPGYSRIFSGILPHGSCGPLRPMRPMSSSEYMNELRVVGRLVDLRAFASHFGLFEGRTGSGSQSKVAAILGPCRSLLNQKGHQERAVAQWNPGAATGRASSIELMPMDPNREISKVEAAAVVMGGLQDFGFLQQSRVGLVPGENVSHRRLHVTGDRLTVAQYNNMSITLVGKLCDPMNASNARALLRVLERTVTWPGHLHVLFHMLCAIFRLCFGGFLQVKFKFINFLYRISSALSVKFPAHPLPRLSVLY